MKDIQDRVESPAFVGGSSRKAGSLGPGPGIRGMQVEREALPMDMMAASLTRVHGG